MKIAKFKLAYLGLSVLLLISATFVGFKFLYNNSAGQLAKGSFYISQFIDSNWKEIYDESFGVEYQTKTFTIAPRDGKVQIQINQKNIPYSDVEFVHLNACGVNITPEYAKYAVTGESVLADISADDNNVIVAHEKPVEILWNMPIGCTGTATMTMKANEYSSAEAGAIRFPYSGAPNQTYQFINNGTITIDGNIKEVDGIATPNYSPTWLSGTGHPGGSTYIYMQDDAKYVYLSYDITGDNTNEHGPDWLKIMALNTKDGKEKEYKINDDPGQYGQCGFGLTGKVSYKHQTCEAKIPKADLVGSHLSFYSLYYGTFSGPQFNNYPSVITSPSNTLPVVKGMVSDNSETPGNIGAVKFRVRDRNSYSTREEDSGAYDGVCTADDGVFSGSEENFTCTATEALSYGINYAFDLELTLEGSSVPNAYGEADFTLYDNDYSIVHDYSDTLGSYPIGQFVKNGNKLYGATTSGGEHGYGNIYSMNIDGTNMTSIHSFDGQGDVAGGYTVSNSLVLSGSYLYGMVQGGGDVDQGGVFRLNVNGSDYSMIHSFSGSTDGYTPYGSLTVLGSRLYGMNVNGGINSRGTIFGLDMDGTNFSVIHSFAGPEGGNPFSTLIESGGVLYGMTNSGGLQDNFGVIFSILPSGADYHILHSFSASDGFQPSGSLTLIGETLFGATQSSGAESGNGIIFKIQKSGADYSIIHNFGDDLNDGDLPTYSSLQLWGDKLYGVTDIGGDNNMGTIFSINTDGTGYSLLHEFAGGPYDGQTGRFSVLISNGVLYGTTFYGGTSSQGAMFKMTLPGAVSNPGSSGPVFTNLPSATTVINITDGQTITTNPYTLKVKPTDADGIQKVEFYIDNILICTDTTADVDGVYSCDWDTSKYHSDVKVLAYDTNGNVSTALTRSATVRLASTTTGTLPETGGKNNLGNILWLIGLLGVAFVGARSTLKDKGGE
ncbi:MAG: choice-of-anchor tandem repeat GloVer-containing protein [bacterium]